MRRVAASAERNALFSIIFGLRLASEARDHVAFALVADSPEPELEEEDLRSEGSGAGFEVDE